METSTTTKPGIDDQIKEYLASLDDVHRQTIEIAKQQLGDAYDTKTSIGFITWKEKKGY
mgnify:FL=1